MARFVIMGVSGCGKTSVGTALMDRIGLTFIDGDDLHPESNVAKMASGVPLDDTDRAPWLADVGRALAKGEGPTAIGCSALKRTYRDLIRAEATNLVHFLHLSAPQEVLQARVDAREGHFMPPSLLASQYAALQPLEMDELGQDIDISRSFSAVVADCETYIRGILA